MHCTFWINEYLLLLSGWGGVCVCVCVCVCVVGGGLESRNGIFRKTMDYDKNLSDYTDYVNICTIDHT